ncbi:MAG: GntR family transcriptional regulator [Armatimonadota bacterium]
MSYDPGSPAHGSPGWFDKLTNKWFALQHTRQKVINDMIHRPSAYHTVAETLREQILSGSLPPGQKLPSEHALCAEFGVSRITIRRALQILEEELLVQRRQGSGSYVSLEPSRKIPLLTTDFSSSIARHAPELLRRLDCLKWQHPDGETARELHIAATERLRYARRIDALAGTPVAMDDVYLLAHLAEKLTEQDFTAIDFLARWRQRYSLDIRYITQTIEAVPATAEISALLGIAQGDPLLKEVDVMHLHPATPAALFISYYRHDYFRLTSTIRCASV